MNTEIKLNSLNLGLVGREYSGNALHASLGKRITALVLDDKELKIELEDKTRLVLFDDGQSCCEHRYMVTADDLKQFVGAQLLGAEIKSAPGIEDPHGDVHEIEFLDITTSKGVFQVANHNEHNGYYGGFYLRCRLEKIIT